MARVRDSAIETLIREVDRLHAQLARALDDLHEDDKVSGRPQRAVLETLLREGEQTVPSIARARGVSRQRVQIIVNTLAAQKLVEPVANPANRRSSLFRLTAAGRAEIEGMRLKERNALSGQRLPVSRADIATAAETLRKLREHLAEQD